MELRFYPEVLIGLTDEQVRAKTKAEIGNGPYATHICRGCGRVWSTEQSHVATAKVTQRCRFCMEEPE